MTRQEDGTGTTAGEQSAPDDRRYGHWVTRELGPDWVEVEPGIFQPVAAVAPAAGEVEPEALDEALQEALPTYPDPPPPEPVAAAVSQRARSRRGWFRRP